MSWRDVFEIAALVVLLVVTVPPLGRYIAAVYGSRATAPHPATGSSCPPSARSTGRSASTPSASSAGTCTRSSLLAFSLVSLLGLYALLRLQGVLPFNPTDRDALLADRRVQRRRQLRHQHQLAVVLGRGGDEPPHADARARGAELRVGRRRLRGDRRDHPRHQSRAGRRPLARQLLGRPHPRHGPHPAAAVVPVRAGAGLAGRRPEPRRQHLGGARRPGCGRGGRQRRAVDPRRPGRVADRDQGPRHERRRLLQRQLGPPVREPERVDEPPRDVVGARDPVRARRRVRHPDPRPAPGAAADGGDGRPAGA